MKMILKVFALPVLLIMKRLLHPGQSAFQYFLACYRAVAPDPRRLRYLLCRSGNVDFAGNPRSHGSGSIPRPVWYCVPDCSG